MLDAPLQTWADAIEAMIAEGRLTLVGRVLVIASTASTQDAARAALPRARAARNIDPAARGAGLVVLAGTQTQGRGRLGRSWHDAPGLGLAMTIALPLGPLRANLASDVVETLSLRVGLGACIACEHILAGVNGGVTLGLRWPNDIVERRAREHGAEAGDGRKLGGILIERDAEATLIGIGINVRQHAGDFDPSLRARAVSLAMLGASATRLAVACEVLVRLERALAVPTPDLLNEWSTRDVLLGTRRTFIHDGERISGSVTGIDPTSHIHVRTDDGRIRSLPALTTSMVHQ